MENHHNNGEPGGSTDDEFQVRMALALTTPQRRSACPSDDDLAALVDNRLDARQRDAILEHISGCTDCYDVWCHASMQAHEDGTADQAPRSIYSNRRLRAAVSILVAACLVIFVTRFLLVDRSREDMSMAKAFDTYLRFQPAMPSARLDQVLRLPWTVPQRSYGFADTLAVQPQRLAFGAGLWVGRQLLAAESDAEKMPAFLSSATDAGGNEDAWPQTQYAPYYYLGQWCVLVKSICTGPTEDLPSAVFQALGDRTAKLKQRFEADESGNQNGRWAISSLGNVMTLISTSKIPTVSKRDCRKAAEDMDSLIARISPTVPPE